jgi:hypothetical protein
MNSLAAGQNLCLGLEKVTITSKTNLAELSFLAYQRLEHLSALVRQLRHWEDLNQIGEVSRSERFFAVPLASGNLLFLS